MHHRRFGVACLVALTIVVLGSVLTGVAAGQSTVQAAGHGPADALPLPYGWQSLSPGQTTWYAFHYAGDTSQVLAVLSAAPAGSANLAIWSPTEVDRWAHGGSAEPTGRGTSNALYGGDLVWAGSSSYGGTWYVVIGPSGQMPTSFSLKLSGSGVSRTLPAPAPTATPYVLPLPLPLPAPAALATPPAVSSSASAAVVAPAAPGEWRPYTPTPTRPAQDPARSLPLPNGPQTLAPGQHTWYAFRYLGDDSRILIDLKANPAGSATFTVWSPDVLQRWAEHYFYTPTGRGTPNDTYGGDLIWSGGSIIHGYWYVIVEQNGKANSTYTLQVSGTGIDRTLAPTPVPTPTYALPGLGG